MNNNQEAKPRVFWIFKGTSNFCDQLEMNEDFAFVKAEPEGFYDIVSTRDTVEGGIKVTENAALEKLQAKYEKALEFTRMIIKHYEISEHNHNWAYYAKEQAEQVLKELGEI